MRYPSIRLRLMLGTGLLVALTLLAANIAIYRAFKRTLYKEIDHQLLQSASLLAKSAELEISGLDYEWQEAMKMGGSPEISGVFQFWDMASDRVTKSPELGDRSLPLVYGNLNRPVLKNITLENGHRARAVGLLHHPFVDQETMEHAAELGKILKPEDHPQVVVCARETESVIARLVELKIYLIRAATATLLVIWGAIFAISKWCLRPIRELNDKLLERSRMEDPPIMEIPRKLPSELLGLARTFNIALDRVEKSRAREKDFALHAAHELRTPVSGIYATLEQAIRRPRSCEELISRIKEALVIVSGTRLTLDTLMGLARLRGRLEVSVPSPFDPLRILQDLIEQSEGSLRKRGLKLTIEFPVSVSPVVSDAGLFKILVSNLIDNAIRHSPHSSSISLRAEEISRNFVFSIQNPSVNIRAEDIGRLFQPFQRGSKAAHDEEGHAGLGLSLAKEAATLLGGSIRAKIDDGDTIIFTIEIPCRV